LSQNDLLVALPNAKFGFLLFWGIGKTTLSSSSPSIHAIINQKTNKMIGGINQHCSFLFLHLFEYFLIEGDEALRDEIEVQT